MSSPDYKMDGPIPSKLDQVLCGVCHMSTGDTFLVNIPLLCSIFTVKMLLMSHNNLQHSQEDSIRCRLWASVNILGTHLPQTLWNLNLSYKMVFMEPLEMPGSNKPSLRVDLVIPMHQLSPTSHLLLIPTLSSPV